MTKLFVGGLTYSVTSQDLQTMFEVFGVVQSAQVITDKYTSQSKGFGFVEMADDKAAQEAIKALDGSDKDGRRLGVSVARPREDRPNTNFNDNRNYFKNNGGGRGGNRNRY